MWAIHWTLGIIDPFEKFRAVQEARIETLTIAIPWLLRILLINPISKYHLGLYFGWFSKCTYFVITDLSIEGACARAIQVLTLVLDNSCDVCRFSTYFIFICIKYIGYAVPITLFSLVCCFLATPLWQKTFDFFLFFIFIIFIIILYSNTLSSAWEDLNPYPRAWDSSWSFSLFTIPWRANFLGVCLGWPARIEFTHMH